MTGSPRPRAELPTAWLRVHWRPILVIAACAVAVHTLLPQVGELRTTVSALRHASWWWVASGLLAFAASYLAAAVAQVGASPGEFPLGRTTEVQVAGSFANQLAPAGLGAMGVNLVYMEHAGVERATAVAALSVKAVISAALHAVGLVVAIVLVGRRGIGQVRLPAHWPVLLAVALALAAVGVGWTAVRRHRHGSDAARGQRPERHVVRDVVRRLRRPVPVAQIVLGSAGVTLCYLLSLIACLQAVDAQLPVVDVAAAYLGGTAVASAAPTPGGLGAVEAGIVAGLTALGGALGPAIAGVLTFRLLSFWLPIVPGLVAFRRLRRRGVL